MRLVVAVVHRHDAFCPARWVRLLLLLLLRFEGRLDRSALGVVRFGGDLEIHYEGG